MLSPFQQALGNAKLSIATLGSVLILSLVGNLWLGYALAKAPEKTMIYVRGLPTNAQTAVPLGQITKQQVYSIAELVWTSLNNWQVDGYKDVPLKLDALHEYMTPNFRNQYAKLLDELNKQGYVKGYKQIMQPSLGSFFNSKDVHTYGNGWVVKLTGTSDFYYNPDGKDLSKQSTQPTDDDIFRAAIAPLKDKPVKTLTVEYYFLVVPYPNEYGLAIGGFMKPPKVISETNNLST
jgi:hypothetical protein